MASFSRFALQLNPYPSCAPQPRPYAAQHLLDTAGFLDRSPSSAQLLDHGFYPARASALPNPSSMPYTASHWSSQSDLAASSGPSSVYMAPPQPCTPASASASTSSTSSSPLASMTVPQQRLPLSAFAQAPDADEPPAPASAPSPSPPPPRVREKRHACWMCHKSFDRPSTLRKHLLVHTGEKAYACETCGRRFGVASNLNRHTRRCVLRPVHAVQNAAASDEDTSNISNTSTSTESAPADVPQPDASPANAPPADASADAEDASASRPRGRARTSTIAAASARPSSGTSTPPSTRPRPAKRRRRAPSPSHWIPPSLLTFDLTPPKAPCAVPLAPVVPYECPDAEPEERNSYGDWPFNPYHPRGWRGRLPGPGLPGDLVGAGMMVGRLILA